MPILSAVDMLPCCLVTLLLLVPGVVVLREQRTEPVLRVYITDTETDTSAIKYDKNGKLYMDSPGADLLLWISEKHHYRIDYIDTVSPRDFSNQLQSQIKNNFNNSTMTGNLNKTGFDVLMMVLILNEDRIKLLEMPPSKKYNVGFAIPYPTENTKLWAFVEPFSLKVWLSTVSCIIILGAILKLINRQYFSKGCSKDVAPDPMWFVFSLILNQAGYFSSSLLPNRLVVGSWCVVALILSNVYLSLLVTRFAAPNRLPLVTTFQQLAEKSDIIPITVESSYISRVLRSFPANTIPATIAARLDSKLNCQGSDDQDQCLERIKTHKAAYLEDLQDVLRFLNRDFHINRKCSTALIDPPDSIIRSLSTHFVLPKDNPYARELSLGAIQAAEYGLIEKWTKTHTPEVGYCSCCNWKKDRPHKAAFKFSDIASAFIILAFGLLLALGVLVCELAARKSQSMNASLLKSIQKQ